MTENQISVIKKIYDATSFCALWYDVPLDRLRAHAWQESTWCREGTDPEILSPEGHGKGLFQIDDGAHRFASCGCVFDILLNTAYAARFLASLFKEYGDWNTASKRYNGSGTAARHYETDIEDLIQQKPWMDLIKQAGVI